MTSQPTNTEVEALIDEISKWSGEFLNVDTSDMEYDGFNAKSVLKSFLSIKNSMKISNDEFRTDAVALVKIGLMKGNITAKTKKKMTKDGISRLDALLSKYNIKTGVAGSKLAKEDISIPRIVNSFPQIAVQLCHSEGLGKNFSAGLYSTTLPAFIKTTAFPSCLPHQPPLSDVLLECYVYWSTEMSLVLSGKAGKSIDPDDFQELVQKQRNFAQVSHNSDIIKEASRVKIMKTVGADLESNVHICLAYYKALGGVRSLTQNSARLLVGDPTTSAENDFAIELPKSQIYTITLPVKESKKAIKAD